VSAGGLNDHHISYSIVTFIKGLFSRSAILASSPGLTSRSPVQTFHHNCSENPCCAPVTSIHLGLTCSHVFHSSVMDLRSRGNGGKCGNPRTCFSASMFPSASMFRALFPSRTAQERGGRHGDTPIKPETIRPVSPELASRVPALPWFLSDLAKQTPPVVVVEVSDDDEVGVPLNFLSDRWSLVLLVELPQSVPV